MSQDIWAAAALGAAAGLAPGPLLVLVAAESLARGFRAGLRVAVAPLLTDAPIALLCLGVFTRLAGSQAFLRAVSAAGAAYLIWLAVDVVRRSSLVGSGSPSAAFKQSLLVNLLNPAPYIFWTIVGAPAMRGSAGAPSAWEFVGLFYAGLVGSKILMAGLFSAFGRGVAQRWYGGLRWGVAGLFLAFALLLGKNAVSGF